MDRTSELVAEFSKEMDTRTYDLKMKAVLQDVIDHFDTRLDMLTDAMELAAKIIAKQEKEIAELKNQLGTM